MCIAYMQYMCIYMHTYIVYVYVCIHMYAYIYTYIYEKEVMNLKKSRERYMGDFGEKKIRGNVIIML